MMHVWYLIGIKCGGQFCFPLGTWTLFILSPLSVDGTGTVPWLWPHGLVQRKTCDLDGWIHAFSGTLTRNARKRHFSAFWDDRCQGPYKHWVAVAIWWESTFLRMKPTQRKQNQEKEGERKSSDHIEFLGPVMPPLFQLHEPINSLSSLSVSLSGLS